MATSSPTAYNPRTTKETDIKFAADSIILAGYSKKLPNKIQNNDLLTDAIGKIESRVEDVENAGNNIEIKTDTLKLSNYVPRNSSETNNTIQNGDTLNTTIGKLDLKINNAALDLISTNNKIDSLDDKYTTKDEVDNKINDKLKNVSDNMLSETDVNALINDRLSEYDKEALTSDQINSMIDDKISSSDIPNNTQVNDKIANATKDLVNNNDLNDKLSGFVSSDYVNSLLTDKIESLVSSAPKALDTLNELANALGNDPNFSTSMTNLIDKKIDKSGGKITGNLEVWGKIEPSTLVLPTTPGSENGSIWIA